MDKNTDVSWQEDSMSLETNVGIGYWCWDLLRNEVKFSEGWKRLRQRSLSANQIEETLLGVDSEAKHQLSNFRNELREGIRSSFKMDYRVHVSNDRDIWIEERSYIETDQFGQAIRMIGCEIDVTHRKQLDVEYQADGNDQTSERQPTRGPAEPTQVEAALREKEQMFASLAAAAPVGIVRMDSSGKNCIYVNQRWGELTGRTPESALGEGFIEAIHPQDFSELVELYERFSADKSQFSWSREIRHVMPDGTYRWVQCDFAKELDVQGNVAGYIGTLTDIEKFKQSKEQYQLVNERMQKVLSCSSIGIWVWNWKDNSLVWDDQMFQIYGVDRSDFRGRYDDWSNRLHPDDRENMTSNESKRLTALGESEFEFKIIRPSGELRHIYSNVYIEYDEQGEPCRTTGINVDITDRRKAEIALLESENKFQRIANRIPGMVYRYVLLPDGSDRFDYISFGANEIYEIAPETALKDSTVMWQRIHEEDRESFRNKVDISADKLLPFMEEFRIVLPNKGIRWVHAYGQPFETDKGEIVWDGIILDHTERKTAQIELGETKSRMTRMTENIPGMVYRYIARANGAMEFVYVSPESFNIFGCSPEEAIEDASHITSKIIPEDLEAMLRQKAKEARSRQAVTFEFRVITNDSRIIWCQCNCQPDPQNNGDVIWDGVVVDITDRKRVELELRSAKIQIEHMADNIPGMVYRYLVKKDATHVCEFASSKCLSNVRSRFASGPTECQFIVAIHSR